MIHARFIGFRVQVRVQVEQFVRNHFAEEVAFQRKISGRTLVVLTDADIMTVEQRQVSLSDCLPKGKERKPDERIAILIPKRNIETWIHALDGAETDETTDYKSLIKDENVQSAVSVLVARRESHPEPEPKWPPSLKDAYTNELPRINKP